MKESKLKEQRLSSDWRPVLSSGEDEESDDDSDVNSDNDDDDDDDDDGGGCDDNDIDDELSNEEVLHTSVNLSASLIERATVVNNESIQLRPRSYFISLP